MLPGLQGRGFPRLRRQSAQNPRPATLAFAPTNSNPLRSSALIRKVNFKARAEYGSRNGPPGSLANAHKLTWTHTCAHIHTSWVYAHTCTGDTPVHRNWAVQAGRKGISQGSELQETQMQLEPMQARKESCWLMFWGWMVGSRTRHWRPRGFSPTSHLFLNVYRLHTAKPSCPNWAHTFPPLCQLQLAKIPGKASDWPTLGHLCASLDQSLCPKGGEWQGLVPKGEDCHMENYCELKSHPNLGEVPVTV